MDRLINGDCYDHMPSIVPGEIDMILTDPPYDIEVSRKENERAFYYELKDSNFATGFNIGHFLDCCLKLFSDSKKFCCVVTCSTKQIKKYIDWAEKNKMQYDLGVQHKTNPVPFCNFKYLCDLEYWLYIKGPKSKILGNYHSKSKLYSSKVNSLDKRLFGHPTIKPIDLMKKFIVNHTTENQVIFDPFMGTGSSGVAAKILNRKFIGIELNKKYFEIAKSRMSE